VGLGTAGRTAAWTFGMILVTQAAGVVDAQVASKATGEASIATMHYGWLIFMLPHSIIAVSIGMAYFTRMSRHARDGDLESVRTDVSTSLRSIMLLLTFSAIGLMVLAFPVAAVFGQTYDEVRSLALVLIVYLVGLTASSAIYVLQRVFFSLEDTRTPFFLQCLQAAVFVSGALIVATWPHDRIAIGLAGSITVAVIVQTVAAFVVLSQRLGGIDLARVARRTLWFHAAMVPAAAAGIGILALLGGVGEGALPVSGIGGAALAGVTGGLGMLVVYAAVLALTRNPEFLAFARPVVARLRRR
jgi:putative peptidoglycan lipid II flippase